MRYHLWFVHLSQNGPHGVTGLPRCNGRNPGLSPTAQRGSGGCSKVYSYGGTLLLPPTGGSLGNAIHTTLPLLHSMRNIAQFRHFVNHAQQKTAEAIL